MRVKLKKRITTMATTRKRPSTGFNPSEDDQTPSREELIATMLEQAPGEGDPDVHAKLAQLADSTPTITSEPVTHPAPIEPAQPVVYLKREEKLEIVEPVSQEPKIVAPPKRHPRNIPKFSRVMR